MNPPILCADIVEGTSWFYIERSHLRVVVEVRDSEGNYLAMPSVSIPWRQIYAAIECKNEAFKPKHRKARRKP